jgi:5-methylcytosine-specific restriction endonuclease McrA
MCYNPYIVNKEFHMLKICPHCQTEKPIVALGGTNDISNIQLLCPKCNLSKHKKHPQEYAKEHGMLF